jgi:phosphoglycolate phosphatase
MKIRGLVFDKDGTLFDFHATWAAWGAGLIERLAGGDPLRARSLAAELGFDLDAIAFLPGSPLIAGTMEFLIDAVMRLEPGVDEAALRAMVLDETEAVRPVEILPLGPLLGRLASAGFRLGVATNDAESPARAHLASAGVLADFDFVAGYDSGFGPKPGPGMLAAFCAATGLAPGACAMIGDSWHDLEAARSSGMMAVAVLSGPATRAELAADADVILRDIADLPAWLGLAGGVVGDDGFEPPTFSV